MGDGLKIDRQALMALAADALQLSNPPGQIPPGALAGERVSRQQGRGLNFDSLRRYQPGDDVRLIDWQATARLRTPWIRLYNEERERAVFILLDQRLDMYFGTRGKTKSVAGAQLAALLAWRSWHDGDRLGSVVFDDDTLSLVPVRSPKQSVVQILTEIERYNRALPERYPTQATQPQAMADILLRISAVIPRGGWLALIGDFHDLDARCEALLANLRKRCEISAFVMLDDLHLRLPAQGVLAAQYETHHTVLALSASLRKRIKESITARLSQQEERLARLGIRVNQIVVSDALLPQLQKGF